MTPGDLAHKLTDAACDQYRAEGRALVSYAGPRIVNPRPQAKGRFLVTLARGPVDYVGHDSKGLGFRFDLKASKSKTSLNVGLSHLPMHQRLELLWCDDRGVDSGLLVCRMKDIKHAQIVHNWYWVPTGVLVSQFAVGGRWGSIRWSVLEARGLALPTLDTTGRVPDFLDAIISWRYSS